MQEYEELKKLVEEIEMDVNKAAGGNKAAGTRVRKQMQVIKQACQGVRNRILEIRAYRLIRAKLAFQLGLYSRCSSWKAFMPK